MGTPPTAKLFLRHSPEGLGLAGVWPEFASDDATARRECQGENAISSGSALSQTNILTSKDLNGKPPAALRTPLQGRI